MPAPTDALIDTLIAEATSVVPLRRPLARFARWLVVLAVYVIGLLAASQLRPDLLAKLHTPLFLLETAVLAGMIITTLLAACYLSYPDMAQKRWVLVLPVLCSIIFIVLLAVSLAANPSGELDAKQGIECFVCITLFSFLPAVLLFRAMRIGATTQPMLAGGLAVLASSSVGALVLKLCEQNDSAPHFLVWHYVPLLGFSALGLWLGKKLLQW